MNKFALIFAAATTFMFSTAQAQQKPVKDTTSPVSLFQKAFEGLMSPQDVKKGMEAAAQQAHEDSVAALLQKTFGGVAKILDAQIIDKSEGHIAATFPDARTFVLTSYYTTGREGGGTNDAEQSDLAFSFNDKTASFVMARRDASGVGMKMRPTNSAIIPAANTAKLMSEIAAWANDQFDKKDSTLKIPVAVAIEKAVLPGQ